MASNKLYTTTTYVRWHLNLSLMSYNLSICKCNAAWRRRRQLLLSKVYCMAFITRMEFRHEWAAAKGVHLKCTTCEKKMCKINICSFYAPIACLPTVIQIPFVGISIMTYIFIHVSLSLSLIDHNSYKSGRCSTFFSIMHYKSQDIEVDISIAPRL